MQRVPVHVVAGAGGSALLARLLAERPDWAAISPRACPCCTGRVELQVALVRLLRERRPQRVLVALADAAHLAAFERVLAERPLARYVMAARSLLLPAHADAGPAALEAVEP